MDHGQTAHSYTPPRAPTGAEPQVVPIGFSYHTVRSASFGYLPNAWSTLPDVPTVLDRRGTSAEAIAVSWRYMPNPSGPADELLPRNGLMVSVLLLRSGSTTVNLCRTTPRFPDHPARTLPLRLPRTTSHALEG